MDQYLIFGLDGKKFATLVSFVERVVRVVAMRELAHSSPHVLGVIDVQGEIISVVNLRTVLGLPNKEISLTDYLLICSVDNKRVALLIDTVMNTDYCERQEANSEQSIPLPEALDHLIKHENTTVPVYQLERLFSQLGVINATSNTG